MRRKRRGLSPEEVQVWHHVARQAKPLPGRMLPELPEETPPAVPAPLPIAANHPPKPPKKAEPRPIPPLAPLDRRARRDVARGLQPLDGRIDLHGLRQAEAHRDLLEFLYAMHHLGAKLVLVITGKGGGLDARGEERGVLRRLVPHWLADPALRSIVLGYEASAPGHGGEGALYVRLRRARRFEKA
ncbi:MAG: Smr/MutS family protein [Methylobacterium sp.]|nr:Smr/MutS family protein [Methylobacterium sp.]MCA3602747.1 Smr/MutS family protein [Methylobacterium sp.]MCA3615669.1 Smr/MutS family protein [Methylobacterium sp.]MCA3624887.1 Smr/MutS family protein [Methylobacterium sp.]MCA4908785.1 Smr/MutS family protein [Methylobacterium sp.]